MRNTFALIFLLIFNIMKLNTVFGKGSLEYIKVFPDPEEQKIILIESNAIFVFKNCPEKQILSETVEIPEIGAKW